MSFPEFFFIIFKAFFPEKCPDFITSPLSKFVENHLQAKQECNQVLLTCFKKIKFKLIQKTDLERNSVRFP